MGEHSKRLLSFAIRYPIGWHGYGKDRTTVRAVNYLCGAGFLEHSPDSRQFRLALPERVRHAVYSVQMAEG